MSTNASAVRLNATTVIPILLNELVSNDCPTSFEEFISYDKTSRSLLFQSSQLVLVIGSLIPFGRYCSTITHGLLGAGYTLMSVWLYFGPCYQVVTPNLMYWVFLLSVINLIRSVFLFFYSFDGIIRRDLRIVYKKLFQPLGVTPATFRALMDKAKVEQLDDGDQYAVERQTKIDRLAILISGRIAVSSGGAFLHSIYPGEFLDSPEWESSIEPRKQQNSRNSSITGFGQQHHNNSQNNNGNANKPSSVAWTHFNISLTATTPSLFVYWNREDLLKLLKENEQLSALMSVILARDITNKLYQMNSRMAAQKCSEIDIRLPVIITSFRRQIGGQPNIGLEQNNCSQNSVAGSVRLKNQSSFGGETSSTSMTAESRSNSLARRLNEQEQYELQSKQRRKSNELEHRGIGTHSVSNHVHYQINHSNYRSPNRSQHYSTRMHEHCDATSIPLLSTPNGEYSQLIL